MFDFAWSEIAVLGVVALIFIGPKDLPNALRSLAKLIKSVKKMAADFQAQVEEIANNSEIRDIGSKLRSEWESFDVTKEIENTIDPDKTLSSLPNDPAKPLSSNPDSKVTEEVDTYSAHKVYEEKLARQEEEKRLNILKECPSILQPTKAIRIHKERNAEKVRPSCLPPEFSIHQGKRIVVHPEEGSQL